jgi:hypothetical protein
MNLHLNRRKIPPWPHAESWAKLETAWGDPILHQQLCRDLWTAFSDIERERFLRVIRGYLAWRMKQRTMPNRCNIQKLMREIDAWPGYEKLAGPDPALRTFVVREFARASRAAGDRQHRRLVGRRIAFDARAGRAGFGRRGR